MQNPVSVGGLRSGVKPPRQRRSNETFERILDRAEALLDGRDFESVTVLEILQIAEVSSSSLYQRFGDKDALLRALHVRHFERMRALATSLAASNAWDDLKLVEMGERLILVYLAHRRKDAPRIQTFRQAERRYPEFAARRLEMDLWLLKLAGDYFDARLQSVGRSLDRRDFALACLQIGWSIEASASTPESLHAALGGSASDEWLARSLIRMASGLLELDDA